MGVCDVNVRESAARVRAPPYPKFSLGSAMAEALPEKTVETASYRNEPFESALKDRPICKPKAGEPG